jgi:DNA-binding response OmpR family regulator
MKVVSGRYDAAVTAVPSRPAVLVADDEPHLLPLMQRVLVRAGYEVLTAPDGARALEVFGARGGEIAVAVLDAAIAPEGSGRVVEGILAHGATPALVLTSGDALPDALQQLLLAHDGLFLRKPFSPSSLLRAVEDSTKGDAG